MLNEVLDENGITIQAVVFDMDGLMFDSEALYHQVTAELLAEKGKSFTSEIMRAMIGRRAPEAGLALKQLAGLEESVDDLLAIIRERFLDRLEVAVHPTPGLFVLLDRIQKAGLPMAVATSSQRAYAESLLSFHGLMDRFQFVLTSEDVTRGKPDPEIYSLAASRLGYPASAVLVLEDSPPGVAAARSAGAVVIGIPHDHSPAEDLQHANWVAPRLDDPRILRLIGAGEP